MLLGLPRPYAELPEGPVAVNYGHPLCEGLTGLWLFNENMIGTTTGVGGPYNLVSNTPTGQGFGSSAQYAWTRNARGKAIALGSSANVALTGTTWVNQAGFMFQSQVTIVLIMRLRGSGEHRFGITDSGGASDCSSFCPYSDNIIYWDFGGSRVQSAALTWGDTPHMVGLTAGPYGQSIYFDGTQVATTATAKTRTPHPTLPFDLTTASGPTDYNFLASFAVQWTPTKMMEWMAQPFGMFYQPRRFFFFEPATPPPVSSFTIAGTPRDILQNWSISKQLNERGTMRFGIKSMDASYRPGLREVVDFTWVGIHFFAGHIHHTDESALAGVPYGVVPIQTLCGATDFGALPDRRQVSGMTLAAGTLKSQFTTLAAHLAIYGVTVDPAQVDGPAMPEMVLASGKLTVGFQNLSVASGYAFEIDYDLVARMFDPGTEAAPFDIEDGDGRVIGDVKVSPTTVEYGNYIIVRFTTPAVAAWAFFTLTDIPSEDETVTIGSVVYTWKASPSGGNEVQIGGSVAACIDNIIGAVFPSHPEVVAFEQASDVMRITAITAGASGNGIQVHTTCVDGEWTTEGGGEVSHLNLGSDAALTGVSIAEDVPAQDGGLNLFEKEYQHPEVENQEAADALAEGYLVRSLVQPREIRYRTRLHGLHPGQQQQIQVTGRNVDGPCLITAVDITPEGSALYNYDVTAVEGLVIVPSHQDGWRQMAGRAVSGN